MNFLKKPDLITRRGIAAEKASIFEQKYYDTGKDKYLNKAEKYKSEIQGIDICLSKNIQKTYKINTEYQKETNILSKNQGNFAKNKKK